MKCSIVTGVCLAAVFFCSQADDHRQIPCVLQNSWIYLSAGMAKTYFEPTNFAPSYANNISDEKSAITALRISIGHYFNPYLALAISLMRGAHSNKISFDSTEGASQNSYSYNQNLFTVALRPSYPFAKHWSVYGEVGAGMISRKGFQVNGVTVAKDANILDGLLGAGINYELPHGVLIGLDSEYAPAVSSHQQPAILYVGLGLGFQTDTQTVPTPDPGDYVFPLNSVELNYVNQNLFYADVARYFTPPYVPIFFDGAIKIAQGLEFMYERNFFHTDKNFSLEWGVSAAGWDSRLDHQDFYTLSIFPELKVWMFRSPVFDFYFTYSLAGPSYISRRVIDGIDSGSHFTFQDFLGFGALLGHSKHANISLKIIHYSNGNSLPENPGVDVPIMLGLGYMWS